MLAANAIHHMFTHRGENASYQIKDGWMRVSWNGAISQPHEVRATPEIVMAMTLLVQMREWQEKYPDGVPQSEK